MPEAEVPKDGNVPSAPNVQHLAAARASQPHPLVNRIALGIVIALLWGGLLVGASIWGLESVPRLFRPASSVSIARLSCVSVEDVKYDAKEFSDPKLADAVVDILGIKTVLFNADYEACPWGLYLSVVLEEEPTVRRDGSAVSRFRVGFARRTDGAVRPDDCISRNIHRVVWRAVPHELLTTGLHALMLRQIGESP